MDFFKTYVRATGRALVVGSRVYPGRTDRRVLYAEAEGWDLLAGPGVDRVVDLEQPIDESDFATFNHVDCVSVLEHTRHPWLIAQNIEKLLKPNGTLFIEVPCVWRYHPYPIDCWRFMPEGVQALFPQIEWKALLYVNDKIVDRLRPVKLNDYPFFPRTEVCGMGTLRGTR